MGTFSINTPGRPEPLLISVKRVGDSTERFISRTANTVTFDDDPGPNIAYVNKITDANGVTSTANFTTSCERPEDCQDGPFLLGIVSFNALEITYQFHGVRVNQIRRRIKLNGVIVDEKIDIPGSPTVNSTFNSALDNGDYELEIEGASCSSEPSVMPFSITESGAELAWWTGYPRYNYDPTSDRYRILLSINKAIDGAWYLIRNTDTNTILTQGYANMTPGSVLDYVGAIPGNYHIEVETLSAQLEITEPDEPCENGPELLSVTSLGTTQTQFSFDGLGVTIVEYIIKNSGDQIVATATVNPSSPTVTINHVALSPGVYNLTIKGANCQSEEGVVDNLDFTVAGGGAIDLTSVVVTQQEDGRYKLAVNFTGGVANYTILVRGQANNTIASFGNTTGSPANVVLPFGITPQTVKVSVIDANLASDEITNVVLPPAVPKLNFLQAENFFTVPTKSPMVADGATYVATASSAYNFDIEFVFPNGGLWDFIEKRLRKLSSGVYVEKSISSATGNPQNYAVGPSINNERAFLPRNGTSLVIDGENVFKTTNTWEIRFRARKGGPNGAIIGEITRSFNISGSAVPLSGIILYNRNGDTLGSAITEVPATGGVYPKPTPMYDLGITTFGGVQFNQVVAYYRQKVNSVFTQRWTNSKNWTSLQTTIDPSDWTMFDGADFGNVHTSILAPVAQEWQVEFVAYNGSTVVGSKSAIFNFTAPVAGNSDLSVYYSE
jgi:hypothetical protein